MTTINIGDVILKYDLGRLVCTYKIERVTKTQAISGDTKFKRSYDPNYGIERIPYDFKHTITYILQPKGEN